VQEVSLRVVHALSVEETSRSDTRVARRGHQRVSLSFVKSQQPNAMTSEKIVRSILLIDDDVELCAAVRNCLAESGYRVAVAHDGPSGLRHALHGEHDLIVLDVTLPMLDGFELLRQLRRQSLVPVIMLTAKTAAQDAISSLEHGADDYLTTPFAPAELLARVRAVLRRAEHTAAQGASHDVQAGPVHLKPRSQKASCGGRPLELTATEFAILELLVRGAGRIVSRDEVSAILYQRKAMAHERSIDVHVSHLRQKLTPEAASLIRTIRGVGYMFALTE
jgi:two-component system response regulator CpxR